jgi:integrase/recombinase XerD
MKHAIQDVWFLKKEPTGPLVEYLAPLVSQLVEQGFCRNYIGAQLRVVANFSQWLQMEGITASEITHEHITHYFQGANRHKVVNQGQVATLRRMVDLLQLLGVCQPQNPPVSRTAIEQIIDSFGCYLIDGRGLSKKTLIQYKPFIECFLIQCFDQKPIQLSTLSGKDIIEFTKHQAFTLSTVRVKVATTALRTFLRYAVYRGDISPSLIEVVPTVPAWTMTGIPRAIAPEHIRAVLAHCDRDTAIGRRDYAILTILAHLGLRAGEIVALTLDDIDWDTGAITVNGKGGQTGCLPLPVEVGEALVDYLQHGRPNCKERTLFSRAIAPIKGLAAQQAIATIVRAAITRAGVATPSQGAHQFRHALATNRLRQGATLHEIGQLLRHKHTKTTNIYAKVDIAALRSLSLAWPGGAQ